MALFALGDTHLSLGGAKPMDVFPGWSGCSTMSPAATPRWPP